MKRRDKFWVNNLLLITAVMLGFIVISMLNIINFNNSYMDEERDELQIFQKQIEWAILPYLEKKDFQTVQKYCKDIAGRSIKLKIFDANQNLVASSIPDETELVLQNNINSDLDIGETIWHIYKNSLKDQMIGIINELKVNNDIYYLKLTISEEDVMKSIIHAQSNLIAFTLLFFIFLISGLFFIIQQLRVPFNRLEDSVTKIADGELDTAIEVPKLAVLEELAMSIKKMTQRLKNQILRLKQLEEYKSDFIQSVSHEIKTPITAINSAVELLENSDTEINAQNKECFDIIQFQVKYINSLVNDILSLSEIEVEKTNENKNFKRFNLSRTIETILNYTSCTNVEINIIQEKEIDAYGDEELISRAVTNLLSNALRYSKSNTIDIILSQSADHVQIQVKDYGIGISEEHLALVFDKFYRVDKARSRENGGSGLGLAIVKNIVELHNGTITLESESGKGCNFMINLPLNSFI